jgi:hypothetical protein
MLFDLFHNVIFVIVCNYAKKVRVLYFTMLENKIKYLATMTYNAITDMVHHEWITVIRHKIPAIKTA